MTRTAYALHIPDISASARFLHRELAGQTTLPGHLALMNLLAQSAGFRNFQHFRAQVGAMERLEKAPEPDVDQQKLAQILRHFDAEGRLTRWPAKTWMQHLALWAIWSRLPKGKVMSEREISDWLNGWHLFGDAAILRRTFVELKLVSRSEGGVEYMRQERPPGAMERALIRQLHAVSQP